MSFKKIALVSVLVLGLSSSISFAKLVENHENRTKASLKEELGGEIKTTLNQCVALNEHLAKLQFEIAQLQKRLLAKGEELMDNGPSFKKAGRKPLADSINTAETARSSLASLDSTLNKGTIKSVLKNFDTDICLKLT
ncbi:hypothetical protein KAU11_01435 [Candidatus Babeliales bacterium]|nr:hypothetical protein [Candidatus Babeliales bacterium]